MSTYNRCAMCDTEIRSTRIRYVCCSGIDCGCYGLVLPDNICSEKCYDLADAFRAVRGNDSINYVFDAEYDADKALGELT